MQNCYSTISYHNSKFNTNIVWTCKKKQQNQRLVRQLDNFLEEVVTGSIIKAGVTENKTVETPNDGVTYDNGNAMAGENSESLVQVTERNIANNVRKELDNVVAAIRNPVHDSILTAMPCLVMPRAEKTLRSITGLSGRGTNSVVENLQQKGFLGNMEDNLVITAAIRTNFNINRIR